MLNTQNKTISEIISLPAWIAKGVEVSVLREDLIHPFISGNKARKLKYNLQDFKKSAKKILLTFGGAYSNHLVATAAASQEYGFESIGVVRGEEVDNDYLNFARKCGMKLIFISRSQYRNKNQSAVILAIIENLIQEKWIHSAGEVFILPEGGSNAAAVKGASEIVDDIPNDFNWIACACGTGATLAGISQNLTGNRKALGIPVLKAHGYLEREIERLGGVLSKIVLNEHFHFGGYAKANKQLLQFCKSFEDETGIPVEPVYTGKLFFALNDLIVHDYFKRGEKVTVIHTGGVFKF